MEIGKAMERKIHVDANAWRFCEILLDIELGCDNKSRLCCVLFRSDATSSKKRAFPRGITVKAKSWINDDDEEENRYAKATLTSLRSGFGARKEKNVI